MDTARNPTLIPDDIRLAFGNQENVVAMLRSTVLAANTALTGVLVGTPVMSALAADSLILSNISLNGDFVIAANRGGNSESYVEIDSSAGSMYLHSRGAGGILYFRNNTNTVGNDTPRMDFQAFDSASVYKTYFSIRPRIVANTAGAERGELRFYAMDSGTLSNTVTIDPDGNVVLDEGVGTPLDTVSPALLSIARADGGTSNCLALGQRTNPSVNGHQVNIPIWFRDSANAMLRTMALQFELVDRTAGSVDVFFRIVPFINGTAGTGFYFNGDDFNMGTNTRRASAGGYTVQVSVNSNSQLVAMVNASTGTSAGVALEGYLSDDAGTIVDAGQIQWVKGGTWTPVASTQDADMVLQTTENGVRTEYMRFDSSVPEIAIAKFFSLGNAMGAPGAVADQARLGSADIAAGDARLAVQSEAGSIIYIGNNTIRVTLASGAAVDAVHLNASNELFKVVSSEVYKDHVYDYSANLAILGRLRLKSWDWNGLSVSPGVHDFGLTMESVYAISPELTSKPHGGESIRWDKITSLLIGGWQEHENRLRKLEERDA